MRTMPTFINVNGEARDIPAISVKRFNRLVELMVGHPLTAEQEAIRDRAVAHNWCARPTADVIRNQEGRGDVSNEEMDTINAAGF